MPTLHQPQAPFFPTLSTEMDFLNPSPVPTSLTSFTKVLHPELLTQLLSLIGYSPPKPNYVGKYYVIF